MLQKIQHHSFLYLGTIIILMFNACSKNAPVCKNRTAWTESNQPREVFAAIGHVQQVSVMAISPDGRYLLSGSTDRTIKLWDINTKREIRTLQGHMCIGGIAALVFIPGTRCCASGAWDGVRIWDLLTGEQLAYYNTISIASMDVSPDGRSLIAAGGGAMALIDLYKNKVTRLIPEATNSVLFSPDGHFFYEYNVDGTVKKWDVKKWKVINKSPVNFGQWDTRITLSHDGNSLLVSNPHQGIMALNLSGVSILWERAFKGPFIRLSFPVINAEDKLFVFLKGEDQGVDSLILASLSDGHIVASYPYDLTTFAFLPDNHTLVSALSDHSMNLIDVNAGGRTTFADPGSHSLHYEEGNTITISPDGHYIAYCDKIIPPGNNTLADVIRIWDVTTCSEVKSLLVAACNNPVFLADNQTIAAGGKDGTIRFYSVESGKEIKVFSKPCHTGDFGGIPNIAVSADNKLLLTSCDTTLYLWNMETGHIISSFPTPQQPIKTVGISPDCKYALSASVYNPGICTWEIPSGKMIGAFSDSVAFDTYSASFLKDGRSVLSSHVNGIVYIRDIFTGTVQDSLRRGEIPGESIYSAAASSDSKTVIAGGESGLLKIYEPGKHENIRLCPGHQGSIEAVTFSPDGKEGYSLGQDGTLRIWNIDEGKEVATCYGFTDGEWASITSDGQYNSSPSGRAHLFVRYGMQVLPVK